MFVALGVHGLSRLGRLGGRRGGNNGKCLLIVSALLVSLSVQLTHAEYTWNGSDWVWNDKVGFLFNSRLGGEIISRTP